MTDHETLIETLPTLARLALAYAPRGARDNWLMLLALDARLASVVRAAHEPALAQMRLAWWREAVNAPRADPPRGEPILALLDTHSGDHAWLAPLADAWEHILEPAPLRASAMAGFATARSEAVAGLARALGKDSAATAARRMAVDWSLADVSTRLSRQDERDVAHALAQSSAGSSERLPRALRPLVVLRGVAQRLSAQADPLRFDRGMLLHAMRLGLAGR